MMNAAKRAARPARVLLRASARTKIRYARLQSTSSSASSAAVAGGSSGIVAGMAGGALVFAAGYGYYHFSGAKSIVDTANATKSKFAEITKSMADQAPEPNELLSWFRNITTSYAAFIPGAKSYVDSAFNDLDKVEQNHRGQVNEIVSKAYSEMKEAAKGGLTMETAQRSWEILEKYLKQLGDLASDSASDVLENHPELKEKVGGNLDQLKSMANSYGPEAKKHLDETYRQIKDVIAGGLGVESVTKITQIVQDQIEKVKSFGDEAWEKGIEKAKPYLEKNPEIKKIVEENKEALKQGNFAELYEKIKQGDLGDLKSYVNQAGEKVKSSSVGKTIEQYANMIPGGDQIWPKLMKLQEEAKKHGEEAEKIMKETFQEIADILSKKTKELEKAFEKTNGEKKK